jgi:hypothetical protein
MPLQDNLKLVVNDLVEIRLNLNMSSLNLKENKESNPIQNIVSDLLGNTSKNDDDNNCNCDDDGNGNDNGVLGLLDFLIAVICDTDLTFCDNNFSYLAQRERLCCILRNLRKLLVQLSLFDFEDIKCELISKLLCLLLQIIEKIISIILDLIALEVLCASPGFECRDQTFECIFCNLIKNISDLEVLVNELSCLVLKIASQQIINCTSCTCNVFCSKHKKSPWSDTCDNDWC